MLHSIINHALIDCNSSAFFAYVDVKTIVLAGVCVAHVCTMVPPVHHACVGLG